MRALVLGGTGVLRTPAEQLARAGWDVTATGRDPDHVPDSWTSLGISFSVVDRGDPAEVEAHLGDGADLLVDGQCYTPDQATALARWSRRCGATAMVSSKSVYLDRLGRHSNSDSPPRWPGQIAEDNPTMAFHGEHYESRGGYGANKAEAERVLLAHGERTSILRAGKIHGPGARQQRAWSVVRRVLDGRPVLLVRNGDTVESVTSSEALTAAIRACAERPAQRTLNVADEPPIPARELARLVAAAAGRELPQVDVPADAPSGLGVLPWRHDQILDLSRLRALGIAPPSYADTVRGEVDWLCHVAQRGADGRWTLPRHLDGGPAGGTVDYAAEDAWLAEAREPR